MELEQRLLRAQMNPHFVFNSLNAIQNFIYDRRPAEAGEFLGRFAELMRMILDSSRDEIVPLDQEIRGLKNYLELQRLRFENRFSYSFEMPPELENEEVMIPPMLAQPFIENAIEHAFKGMKENGQVRVRFRRDGEQLIMEVEDNGIGIESGKANALQHPEKKQHRSLAIQITQERLQLLKEERKLGVEMKIIDLKRLNEGIRGTRVTFRLPWISAWA